MNIRKNLTRYIAILALSFISITPILAAPNFTSLPDLKLGDTNSFVKEIQKVLNNNGFTISNTGSGSIGYESNYFGSLTKKALTAFQLRYGITPATGYFGAKTKAKVQELFANNQISNISSGEPVAYGSDTCTSATKDGVTWTFDKAYVCGKYANGDNWVLGPVKITNITPIPTAGRNGTVVNPEMGRSQGFDDRIGSNNPYSESLNVGNNLPLTVVTNSSVVSSISRADSPTYTKVDTFTVLTVVDAIPAIGSFRPPYISTGSRASLYNINQLDRSKLQKLPKVGLPLPDKTILEQEFSKTWYEQDLTWTGRYMHTPYQALNGYGKDMAIKTGNAGLLLNLDYTDAEKEKLLIGVIQYGIDIHGILLDGGTWFADGGHNHGRLSPFIIAAGVLNDSGMKTRLAGQSMKFQEFQQTFFVSQADVNIGSRTATNNNPIEGYTTSDIGTPEWGVVHTATPAKDNSLWGGPYRDIAGSQLTATAMIARVMGLRTTVNWEPLFKYAERHVNYEQSTGYDGEFDYNPTPGFHKAFYNAYSGVTPQPTAPTISTQPQSKTITPGTSATLTVSANGTAPLTYQWYKNSTAIVGATSASYTTPVLQIGGDATYYVRVSNSLGGVNSNSVGVTITNVPAKFIIGDSINVTANVNVRSTAAVTGVLLGTQSTGSTGKIIAGPVSADGYIWWNIDYTSGVDGWSGQDNLAVSSTPVPTYILTTTATNGSITRSPNQTSYTSGTSVTLTATPATGYQFSSWTGCASTTSTCTVTMDSAKSVTANFTVIPTTTYNLTTSVVGSGSISGNSSLYASGATATLTATPSTGYTFSGWSGACTGTGSCSVLMNANKAVTATFTLIPPTSGFTVGGRISVTASSVNVRSSSAILSTNKLGTQPQGSLGTIIAGPQYSTDTLGTQVVWWNINFDSGVDGWSGQDNLAVSNTLPPVTNYTLTTITSGTGTITGNTSPYTSGTNAVVTAVPGNNSSFSSWTGCTSTNGTQCTVNMSSDKTVTANFTVNPTPTYTLTTTSSNGSITRSPNQTSYTQGTSVTLTATPATGYQFSSWTGCTSTTNTCSVTMDTTKTVTANFTLIPVVNPPSTIDDIVSANFPTTINLNQNIDVNIEYKAKDVRSLHLELKTNTGSGNYGYKTVIVPQGEGVKTLSLTVPSSLPTGTTFRVCAYLTTEGGSWISGRKDYACQWGVKLSAAPMSVATYNTATSGTAVGSYINGSMFNTSLRQGISHPDVKNLQKFLNANGYTISTSGVGSMGNESTYFGAATKAALMKYQMDKGITPASGYFGEKTRGVINGN